VSPRPLVLVSGLTAGDYLLWNWSLNAHHDVPALVAGLTLPPLAAASLLMLVLGLARVLGRSANRATVARSATRAQYRRSRARPNLRDAPAAGRDPGVEPATAAAGREPEAQPSRKLAA
jgi:hypothetical protein